MMNNILHYTEKYGLLFVLLVCFSLLPPDLSKKLNMMSLDLNVFNENQSGSNIKKQLLWLLPLGIYFLSFIRITKPIRLNIKQHKIVINFLLIIFVLVISYLINGNSLLLKRIIFQIILSVVLFSAIYFSLIKKTTVICINYLIITILSVCFLSLMLGTGYLDNSFCAWTQTKNSLGSYLLAAILLLWYAKNYLPEYVFNYKIKLFLLILFLFLSLSKTTILLSFIPMLFEVYRLKLNAKLLTYSVFILTSIFILIPAVASFLETEWYIALFMEPDTLTGRGLIWDVLYNDLFQYDKLWVGYGYSSYFGTGTIPYSLDDSYSFIRFLNSAHNGYLELILQLGVILSSVIIFLVYKMIMTTKNTGVYLISLIIFLHNITESSLFRDQHIMWVTLITAICLGVLHKNQHKKFTYNKGN